MKIVLFIAAALVSIIFAFNHLYGVIRYGNSYRLFGVEHVEGVTFSEVYTYAPRVFKFKEGDQIAVSDPLIFENRNRPSPFFGETVPTMMVGFLSLIFGSVEGGFIAADFIFPALIFLLAYYFLYLMKKDHLIAFAGASVTIFLRDLILMIPYPGAISRYFWPRDAELNFLPFTRAFHPQVSFVILLTAIYFLYLNLSRKKTKDIVLLSIFTGMLFYTYIFYWTAFGFGFLVLTLIYLFQKNTYLVKRLILSAIFALIVGLPYFINMLLFRQTSEALSFFEKSSTVSDFLFFMPSVRFLIIFVAVIFLKKNKKEKDYLFLSMILAGALLPNISSLFLGRNLEGIHWIRRFLLPISTIYLFTFFPSTIKSKLTKYLMYLFIMAAFFYGVLIQFRTTDLVGRFAKKDAKDEELFSFINNHLKNTDVVGSLDMKNNLFLPAVTKTYLYLPMSNMTISSPQEILDRFFVLNKILGSSDKQILSFFDDKKCDICDGLNSSWGTTIYYFLWEKNTESQRKREIKTQLKKFNFAKSIKKYKLSYLLIGPFESRIINADFKIVGKTVFSNHKYKLYRINLNEK